jgi:hypothetical protein
MAAFSGSQRAVQVVQRKLKENGSLPERTVIIHWNSWTRNSTTKEWKDLAFSKGGTHLRPSPQNRESLVVQAGLKERRWSQMVARLQQGTAFEFEFLRSSSNPRSPSLSSVSVCRMPVEAANGSSPSVTAPLRITKRRAVAAHEHSQSLAAAHDEFNSLLALTLDGPDSPWTYHGFRSGAHIYSLPSSSYMSTALEPTDSTTVPPRRDTTTTPSSFASSSSLALSSSYDFPCCRGEAVIEGDWELRDLVSTVRSFGARKVWDGAAGVLDDAQCGVVKWLGNGGKDFLARIAWKRNFPVGCVRVFLSTTRSMYMKS